MIRHFEPSDVERVLSLHTDDGQTAEERRRTHHLVRVLYPHLFLDTPWRAHDIGSLVSEEPDGEISGFIGAVARPMLHNGRMIRMAVSSELFVSPQMRSKLTGVALLKAYLNGPQELSVADTANASTRKIWEMLGGTVAPLYGLNWLRPVRPLQFAACLARHVRRLQPLVRVGMPACRLGDWLQRRVAPGAFRIEDAGLQSENLSRDMFVELFPELTRHFSVRPVYDRASIDWLWTRLDCLWHSGGNSRQRLVRDRRGNIVGWYVYQYRHRDIARVCQVVAREKEGGRVLDRLFADAAAEGAAGVIGRVQPELLQPLCDRGCLLLRRKNFALVHSHDRELVRVFLDGRAFLTLLEGEACLSPWNNPDAGMANVQWLAGSDCSASQADVVSAVPLR